MNTWLLVLSQLVSQLGNQLHHVALAWILYQSSGSSLSVGGVFAMQLLPKLLFAGPIGSLADRVRPKLSLITSDLVRAFLVALVPLSLTFSSTYQLGALLLLTFLLNSAELLFYSAEKKWVPNLVLDEDELLQTNASIEMVTPASMVFGPVLASYLLTWLTVPQELFYWDAITYVLSALMIGLICEVRGLPQEEGENSLEDSWLWGYQQIFRSSKAVVLLIAIGLVNFFLGPFLLLFTAWSVSVIQGEVQALGWLTASFGLGMFLGGLLTGTLVKIFWLVPLTAWSMIWMGAWFYFLTWADNLSFSLVCVGLAPLGLAPVNAAITTYIQESYAGHGLAKIFAAWMGLAMSMIPLGYIAIGALLEYWPVRHVVLMIAFILLIVGLSLLLWARWGFDLEDGSEPVS